MTYKDLGNLNKNGQTWNIKVKVMILWESINKTDELMSLDMILMDEKVTFIYTCPLKYCLYLLTIKILIFHFLHFQRDVIWKSMISEYLSGIFRERPLCVRVSPCALCALECRAGTVPGPASLSCSPRAT
jgi:hypothetical protein